MWNREQDYQRTKKEKIYASLSVMAYKETQSYDVCLLQRAINIRAI